MGIRILAPILIVGNPGSLTSSYALGSKIPICADNSCTLIVVFSITVPPLVIRGVRLFTIQSRYPALGKKPVLAAVSTYMVRTG